MKEKLQKIVYSRFGEAADKFYNSVWYIIAIGIICIISHTFGIPIFGAIFFTVLLVPALIFCKNSFVLMPPMMMCAFIMSVETLPDTGYYNTPPIIAVLSLILVLIVSALVFNIVFYEKWRVMFKRAYLTVSLVAITGVLIMSGLGSPTVSWWGVGMGLSIAAVMFLPYSFFVNCGDFNKEKTVEYFVWALITAAVVVAFGFMQKFFENEFNLNIYYVKMYLQLGYLGPNTGSALMTLSIPPTFYLIYKYKFGFVLFPFTCLELLMVVLARSRASLVIAVASTIILSIAVCVKKKNGRLGYYIVFGMIAVVYAALIIAYRDFVLNELTVMFKENITGSGRTLLWENGFKAWLSSPIFGIGMGYLHFEGYPYFSFHNTLLTYLYCAGILGILAYGYHRYKTVRLVFSTKITKERIFLSIALISMLCNALLDIAMTMPLLLIYYSIMLALIECDVRVTKSEASAKAAADTNGIGIGNLKVGAGIETETNLTVGEK